MNRQRNRIFTNVYINNIDTTVDENTLRKLCEEKGGKVVSLVIIRDKVTKASLGYGFCSFSTPQEALRAVTNLGNHLLGTKRLTLSRASSRSERSSFLNSVRQQQEGAATPQDGCANIYVKGLAAYEEEEGLRKMFMRFGEIINVRVMRNPQGKSRGFGFVSFKKVADAKRAVNEMNGCKVGSQVLGVSFYESKKVRSERLSQLHNANLVHQQQTETKENELASKPITISESVESRQAISFEPSQSCSASDSDSESVDVMSDYSSDDSLSQSPTIYSRIPAHASSSTLSSSSSSSSPSPSSPTLSSSSSSSLLLSSRSTSRTSSPCENDADLEEKNTILLSGLRFVSEPKEIRQIFYDFRNVKAEPITSSRAVMSGEWKVSFESLSDAKRALKIVSQNLYVRNRKVSARMLF